jgi:4-amino-4-deoxy-L-arabinose transferase-like glycosyltransferase
MFIFLTITLISIYFVKPQKKSSVWTYAIFIPLVSLITIVALVGSVDSAYSAGTVIKYSLFPVIVSGFVLYLQLTRQFIEKTDKVKTPKLLIGFIIFFLIVAIWNYKVEADTDARMQEIYREKGYNLKY